jgi:signal transduction histidine kinase
MLHEFIAKNRDEIIQRCRAKVVTRSVPPPTDVEIDHGVPVFLDQLRNALRLGELTSPEISRSAIKHGHDLLLQGFTVSQVVHDYGDVCQAITELAVELNAPISTDDFRTLNRCLDDLQNAFKFTRPRTTVTLRVGASAERVLIEIQDECGGLPSGDVNELFRPFEQRSADRTGVGLGLAFSRWGAEANDGRIYARNLPEMGCVFTLDLPRLPVPAVAVVQS